MNLTKHALLILALGFAACNRPVPATRPDGVELGVPARSNANATIASDGARRVVVAWAATGEEGADIYTAVSDDGAVSFGPPVRVNSSAGSAAVSGEQPPKAVVSGDAIHVLWVSKQGSAPSIHWAESRDGGRTFSKDRIVSPPSASGARGWESAAVGDDGAIHAVWLDGRNAAAPMPHMDGAMHHTGTPRQDIYHAVWRANGPEMETRVAANVCFCCKTSVVARGHDVYAAWRHLYPGGIRDIAVARSADDGRSFSAPIRVSIDNWKIDACPDDGPALAFGAGGALHVVWPTLIDDGGQQRIAIFHAVSRDGKTFTPRERVDGARGTDPAHPRVAADARGRLIVVWDELFEGQRQVAMRMLTGQGRLAVQVLAKGANYPAVAATAAGPVVCWTSHGAQGSRIQVTRPAVP